MSNIAAALKSEISRVARKEIRAETGSLKKASSAHRSDISALRKRVAALEQELRRVLKHVPRTAIEVSQEAPGSVRNRFSAKGFASTKERLELSVADLSRLMDTSSQTIYNWIQGRSKPRPNQLAAIAALRSMGKKDVRERLTALRAM